VNPKPSPQVLSLTNGVRASCIMQYGEAVMRSDQRHAYNGYALAASNGYALAAA